MFKKLLLNSFFVLICTIPTHASEQTNHNIPPQQLETIRELCRICVAVQRINHNATPKKLAKKFLTARTSSDKSKKIAIRCIYYAQNITGIEKKLISTAKQLPNVNVSDLMATLVTTKQDNEDLFQEIIFYHENLAKEFKKDLPANLLGNKNLTTHSFL